MARKRKGLKINGWVNLNKPQGLTSTQALGKVRRILNAQKLGHAGTLDPLATGVLPIALGEATKTIPYIQDALKTYTFTITWGEQRDTDDAEGDVIATSDKRPTIEQIKAALPHYVGDIEQTPPQYSAIKVNGQRAYDLARAGEKVALKSRKVFVESLELIPHPENDGKITTCTETTSFRMVCGKGTYVRSIARDLAKDLGTCGYISTLRRDKVGPFILESTISLDILDDLEHSAALKRAVLPMDVSLDDIPALPLDQNEAARLKHGNMLSFVSKPDFKRLKDAGLDTQNGDTAIAYFQGQAVAIVDVHKANVKPVKVFNL